MRSISRNFALATPSTRSAQCYSLQHGHAPYHVAIRYRNTAYMYSTSIEHFSTVL